jgi:dienelactone hydrolase
MTLSWRVLAALSCALVCAGVSAQDLLAALREEVLIVKKPGLFTLDLETTFYRPPGDGPHPLVIINHGKAPGDPRFQARARYAVAAREFVQRGYAVAIPMRQGFSKSSGAYIGGGCNVGSNGVAQAEDVKQTLEHFAARPDIDAKRVVVLGQSHGGLTTLALGTLGLPNVAGLVNFAGGLRQESCPGWEQTLARDVSGYAKSTQATSLWFYGDNDSYFPPRVWQDMHARYVAAGGKARLVAFGTFGADAHAMFGSRAGLPIWIPQVETFFRELGLPFEKKHTMALLDHEAPVPAGTGFAPIDDVAAVPHLKNDAARNAYQAFLAAAPPKAFALAPNGAWSWRSDGAGVMRAALERCQTHAKEQTCKLYAVDDLVVWSKP